MMVRTQIALDAEDHRRAKQRAAQLGVSLAEYVRATLRRDLGDPAKRGDTELFGIADSGGSDVSRNKDFAIYRYGPRRDRAFELLR